MFRRNGYRNMKVGNVRESLGAEVLWSSLDFLCASKKERRVSLGLYIVGEKGKSLPLKNSGKNVSRWIRASPLDKGDMKPPEVNSRTS